MARIHKTFITFSLDYLKINKNGFVNTGLSFWCHSHSIIVLLQLWRQGFYHPSSLVRGAGGGGSRDQASYACKECPATFGSYSGLKWHSIKHGARDFQYHCPFCNHGINSTTRLKQHLRKHGGDGINFYCCLCSSTSPTVKEFEAHTRECIDRNVPVVDRALVIGGVMQEQNQNW